MGYQFLYLGNDFLESFEDKFEELILRNQEPKDKIALRQERILDQIG